MAVVKMRMSGRLPTIEVSHFMQKLEAVLVREQKNAVAAWAKAVIAKIPVYTGTAHGTFAPVNRVIQRTVFKKVSPVDAQARAKVRRGTNIQGTHYQLGFTAGRQYSMSDAYHTVSTFQQTYIFEFVNDLPYILWNEIQPAPSWLNLKSSPPWHALAAGLAAFTRYARIEIPLAIVRDCYPVKFIRVK